MTLLQAFLCLALWAQTSGETCEPDDVSQLQHPRMLSLHDYGSGEIHRTQKPFHVRLARLARHSPEREEQDEDEADRGDEHDGAWAETRHREHRERPRPRKRMALAEPFVSHSHSRGHSHPRYEEPEFERVSKEEEGESTQENSPESYYPDDREELEEKGRSYLRHTDYPDETGDMVEESPEREIDDHSLVETEDEDQFQDEEERDELQHGQAYEEDLDQEDPSMRRWNEFKKQEVMEQSRPVLEEAHGTVNHRHQSDCGRGQVDCFKNAAEEPEELRVEDSSIGHKREVPREESPSALQAGGQWKQATPGRATKVSKALEKSQDKTSEDDSEAKQWEDSGDLKDAESVQQFAKGSAYDFM